MSVMLAANPGQFYWPGFFLTLSSCKSPLSGDTNSGLNLAAA